MKANNLPRHIAIIMDGNGRWAKKRKLPRTRGHLEGIKRVEDIVAAAIKVKVEVLTLYAFSTENWSRPKGEVSMLMHTFISFLKKKLQRMHRENIRIQFIGRKTGIPKAVAESIKTAERLTRNNTRMILNIAFNYGGRPEILDAVKKIARDVKEKKMEIDQISEETVNESLYTKGLRDPDLLIRTSGEKRISNFFLWQLSYTELYFTDKFWPDFTEEEFQKAIGDFKQRERRYGDVASQGKEHVQ